MTTEEERDEVERRRSLRKVRKGTARSVAQFRKFVRLFPGLTVRTIQLDLLPFLSRRIRATPRAIQRALFFLVLLTAVSALSEFLLTVTLPDPSSVALPPSEIARIAQARLTGIEQNLDSGLFVLNHDAEIRASLDQESPSATKLQSDIFPRLGQDYRRWLRVPQDSIDAGAANGRLDTAARGLAVYDANGKLVAWASSSPGIFSFDTVLPHRLIPDRYIQTVRLQKNFFYTYLTDVQKLAGTSHNVGYAVARRLLASNGLIASRMVEDQAGTSGATFLDDVRDRAERDVQITFQTSIPVGLPRTRTASRSADRFELFGDRNDSASHVATLRVGEITPGEFPLSLRAARSIRTLSMVLILLVLLGWAVASILESRGDTIPLSQRVMQTGAVLVALAIVRMLLIAMDGMSDLIGSAYQDVSVFASDWGHGIAQNPLELFTTTLFASIAALVCWSIWMPRQHLFLAAPASPTWTNRLNRSGRMRRFGSVAFFLLAILLSIFLTDWLAKLFEAMVMNGSVQYLIIRQILPTPSLLFMYLSFLNVGVTYLFLVSLLLVLALRTIVTLIPDRYVLQRRFLVGSTLLLFVALISAVLFDGIGFADVGTRYRILLALGMSIVAILLLSVDTFIESPFEHKSSFLYRLPRSSRSILFILALSAVVISPLVSEKELLKDKDVALGIVSDNAEADVPYLKTVVQQSLTDGSANLNAWAADGTETLREAAFILWVTALKDHPGWQAVIDLNDATGQTLSHFGTSSSVAALQQIQSSEDSTHAMLLRAGSSADSVARINAVDLSISTLKDGASPLIVGARRIYIRGDVQPSEIKNPLTLTIALWSELPALQTGRSLLNLGQTTIDEGSSSDQIIASGSFIVTEYLNGIKRSTNVPTLDVPATLPAKIQARSERLTNFWAHSIIDDKEYSTLYHRISLVGMPVAKESATISVSVPEPDFAREVEFGLRLNAIGLIYGLTFAFVLLLLRLTTSEAPQGRRFTLKFRDRIFLIVLSIALVPLIVVTNVTRNLLREPASYEARDKLAHDASVIRDRIGQQITSGGQAIYGTLLQQDVLDLAHTIGRNFNVYDRRGMLLASSIPEYYESAILPSHLSGDAMQQIVLGKQSSFSERLNVGFDRYQIGYQPVRSRDDGTLLAVISVATFGDVSGIDGEIARTTSLIYGTFAALGLILLAIGALFAARVASPIVALIVATERVAKGKLGTSLPVNRQDEIGELMHAFNAMTSELEKSRQIVAQTEREVAWKEMARQVAHEIKNPLTPMKLSVQHIEHAHESKDPNFSSIFRRVIRTLSEQIDVLTRIATEFARFGEMPRRKYALVSVQSLAERAVALFDAERHHIRFVITLPKDLPYVNVDEEEFRRALVNLIRNAIQAIDGWGIVAIRAESDKQMVHIRLSDTGGGMSDETLARAFDPNFSTKTSGMGLGLAIVKKTVTDMGGIISVESKLGKGTTFNIDLPARERPEGDPRETA